MQEITYKIYKLIIIGLLTQKTVLINKKHYRKVIKLSNTTLFNTM